MIHIYTGNDHFKEPFVTFSDSLTSGILKPFSADSRKTFTDLTTDLKKHFYSPIL